MSVTSARHLFAVGFLAAVIAQGCSCERTQVNSSYGDIGIVHLNAEGSVITSREAEYDFGTIPMGDRLQKKLVVKNLGGGALTLLSMERLEGDAVTIGDVVAENAAWDVGFAADTVIGSASTVEFDMVFTPPHAADPNQAVQAHSVKLVLKAGGTREGEETATILLRGTATAGTCQIPTVIDFGKVALGSHHAKALHLVNGSLSETTGHLGDLTSSTGDHLAFSFAPGTMSGEFTLASNTTKDLGFEFRPTETRAYEATVRVRAGTECGEADVKLIGQGVDEVLEWTPPALDFLYVSPGTDAIKQITFRNHGSSDIELFEVKTTLPADFGHKVEAGQDPTKFVVPGNGERKMNVVCRPSQLGPRSATLTFKTPISRQPTGSVSLTCFGGGPDIQVTPSPVLNFGKTAYFTNANPPYSVTRRLSVMNVGTAPNNGNPDGNLRLGKVSQDGVPGQIPYVALKALNATTTADEFQVLIPPSYNPSVGLEAQIGRNLAELQIKFTPKSLGRKEIELTLFSNDPDEPETKVLITADAVDTPPCNYSVSPAQVSFGLVTPGTFKEVPVNFTNHGVTPGDVCLISGVDLAPGTDPAYSMPNGAVASKELGPGETLQVLVRVQPTGQVPTSVVNLTGTLQYFASSPTKPSGTVPLQTYVGPSCLTIAPAHQDFGAAKPNCSAATRTFTIYNICTQTVSLQKVRMQVAGGQAAGGPNCPGTQACPEFHLVQTPAIPSGGLSMPPGGTPVNFQAKYKPIDLGKDSGVIAVEVIQSGLPVEYLVTMEGEGNAAGQNTDVFVQDQQPKADVLFTIDNSCSMDVYQSSLANNFSSFIQYATSANVDWHIGVTTTDMDDGMPSPFPGFPAIPEGAKGKLLGNANNPKILTPTTPDVANKFKQKVNVGIDGSGVEQGLEPSLRALTPPLSVAENAGFVRQDANLAVVVITDAPDQGGKSATYYVNSFLNIKGFNRANMFTFNAVGPFNANPPSSCVYDGTPDDGTYATVVSQTNGIKEEICTQNWAATLQGLGQTAFGFRTTFFLTAVPDPTQPITVKLDGVSVPATSGSVTNWSWDSVSNAIAFHPSKAPGPGQTLEITYFVGCMP